jgi:DNA repair protein RecN (Recombination protein N)
MLTQLIIQNVVLIEKLDMALTGGLGVLTGETGAGKSILLDSLGLGLGERSETNLVRKGAPQASVSLSFQISKNHAALVMLRDMELANDGDDTLILRRVISADGRSKAFINDQPVAVNILKKVGECLVYIHGQFETHGLINRDTHITFLDRFGRLEKELHFCRVAYYNWRDSQTALQQAAQKAAQIEKEKEDIAAALSELTRLAPQAGEADLLSEKRTRLQAHEKIMHALSAAQQDIEDDDGALRRASNARRILLRAAEKAPDLMTRVLNHLDAAENALADAASALDHLLHSDELDASQLDKIEERLFALRAAARKYQCPVDDLAQYQEQLEEKAIFLKQSADHLTKLITDEKKLCAEFTQHAEKLHQARIKHAQALEKAVMQELPPLKLERAQFFVQIEKNDLEQAGARGISKVTFSAAINQGMAPGPLHKIASGGELARFMLALRLCLAGTDEVTALVFDEVDTGIGGATASAVGERLARLGQNIQTLVVTHSPQVAAAGQHHWRVEKKIKNSQTQTHVIVLENEARLEEIARMLAGDTITQAAREAAASLLDSSQNNHKNPSKKRKAG